MLLQRPAYCTFTPLNKRSVCISARKPHVKVAHASADSSTQQVQLTEQQKAFQTLTLHTPICLADITELEPCYKGLSAASDLQRGQTVLQLPACNSLCVPISGSAYRWECDWLEPFEAAHGALPAAMSYFLSEQDVPPLLRVATLILYLKHTNNNSSSSSSGFWNSWLQLLPPLSSATYPGAGWTDSDIQQLQFEPTKAVFAAEATVYKSMIEQLMTHLTSTDWGLDSLGLAANTEDISWALLIAKTRSASDNSSMWLHPIHDFINHSDTPNCQAAPSNRGYIVKAVMDIPIGNELTISYAPPEGLCNLELLIAWGFTSYTKPLDWAFPQTYHLLPPISYNITIAAAVRLALQQQQRQQQLGHAQVGKSRSEDTHTEGLSWEWFDRLAVAAASLPMGLGSSSSSGSTAAVYVNAAAILEQYGGGVLQQQRWPPSRVASGLQHRQQQQDQDPLRPWIHPDPNQAFISNQTFLCDFEIEFIKASKAVKKDSTRQEHWLQNLNAERIQSLQGMNSASLKLQQLSAAAVHNACQLLLLQSGTSVQQDELLLQLLLLRQQEQQQRQQLSIKPPAAAETGTETHLCTNSSNSSGSNPGRNSNQSDNRFAELLQQFDQLQQQLFGHLVLVQAHCGTASVSASSTTSSSSSKGSRTKHVWTAVHRSMTAAAQRVIRAVQPSRARVQISQQQQQQLLLEEAARILLQQDDVLSCLKELQQQQSQQYHHQQQDMIYNGSATSVDSNKPGWVDDICLDSHTLDVLHSPAANTARLLIAVTARLEHKRLLQLCAQLAKEVQLAIMALLQSPATL